MSFNMTVFLKNKLVQGFKDGSFTEAQVCIFAANYLAKGWFEQTDFDDIIAEIQKEEEVIDE